MPSAGEYLDVPNQAELANSIAAGRLVECIALYVPELSLEGFSPPQPKHVVTDKTLAAAAAIAGGETYQGIGTRSQGEHAIRELVDCFGILDLGVRNSKAQRYLLTTCLVMSGLVEPSAIEPQTPSLPVPKLHSRELLVLGLMARGLTGAQVVRATGMSLSAVRTRLRESGTTLGTKDRRGQFSRRSVARLYQWGLVSTQPDILLPPDILAAGVKAVVGAEDMRLFPDYEQNRT